MNNVVRKGNKGFSDTEKERHGAARCFFSNRVILLILFMVLFAANGLAQPYTRQVDAFPVLDRDGVPYTHPLLGGLNVPRIQFVDIDADDDLDLFLQERSGHLIFFENTGSRTQPVFSWRTDHYKGLPVGEWARFADIDNDGDQDLFAEELFSYIRFYRNVGTPQQADFELAADSLKDVQGTPIFADRQNLPAFADIDCDSDLDFFVASVSGHLTFYENQGDTSEMPVFQFVSDRYQDIEIIGGAGKKQLSQIQTPNSKIEKHGANSITFSDIDKDEDVDLFWGDFFSQSVYFVKNNGTCDTPQLELVSDTFPLANPIETSGYNAPAFADLDGDEDNDLFVSVQGGAFGGGPFAGNNLYHYSHEADASFTLQTRQFISSLDVDEESTPAFADLDGDGDLDLLVGNKIDPVLLKSAQLFYFENTGSAEVPVYQLVTDLLVEMDGLFNAAPALADLDADQDLDMLLGGFDGTLAYFRNEGTSTAPQFVAVSLVEAGLREVNGAFPDVGQNSTPTFADIDADGDFDLFVGEAAGHINFFRNVGTSSQPDFVLDTTHGDPYFDIDVGARSVPIFHDATGDGLLDLIAGTAQHGILVYENTGTYQNAFFNSSTSFALPEALPQFVAPTLADLDADGDADLGIGSLHGGLFYYRNERIETATEEPSSSPVEVLRIANFPNPFRASTTLQVHLAHAQVVRLVVYDVLGRTVRRLVDGRMEAGIHDIVFDAKELPSGLYMYTLMGYNGTLASGKMILVQ